MKRRDLLKMNAGLLLAAGLWPGRLLAAAAKEDMAANETPWKFIQVNDLHFHDAECKPWFERIVAAMKQSAPDAEFCLIVGDLADGGKAEQLTGVRDTFQGLGMPIYTTPGNHDYLSNENRTAYEQIFPNQINQAFEHRGWQFIGLDSTDGARYHETSIQPATFSWVDEQLPKLSKTKPTIIWTHFPMGVGVHYRPINADDLLGRFLDFNVQAVFNGHWHGYTEKAWQHASLTTDRCCARVRDNHDGTPEKGWFVCTVQNGTVTRQFVEIPKDLRAEQPAAKATG